VEKVRGSLWNHRARQIRAEIVRHFAIGCHDQRLVMSVPTWTDADTRELINLWPTHSASQIAARLRRPRSAVSGKAKRLRAEGRLPRGVIKHYEINPVPPPRRGRLPQIRRFNPGTEPADGSLAMQPCSILELDRTRCHWPLGGFSDTAAQFCGGATAPGHRYCPRHLRIAHGQGNVY
jgi:GcrA cell cycle regulator